jgi:hypothetical protein
MLKQLLAHKNVVDLRGQGNAVNLFAEKIKELIPPSISFEGNKAPLFFAHRSFQKKHFYWIANKSGEKISSSFRLKYGQGQAQRWDSENGTIIPVHYTKDKSGALIKYDFEPFEGFWLVFDDALPPVKELSRTNFSGPVKKTITPGPSWTISTDTSFISQVTEAIEVRDLNDRKTLLENPDSRISILGKKPVKGTYWKIRIPINAEKVSLSGLEDAQFYIDGQGAKVNNNTISIPLDAKHLFISSANQNNTSFIDKPLLFTKHTKNESRTGKLVSLWVEPIHRLLKLRKRVCYNRALQGCSIRPWQS